jgi:hypothetical protein
LFVLSGFGEAMGELLDTGKLRAIMAGVCGLLVGALIIYFSKPLANLFCRGLDDDLG